MLLGATPEVEAVERRITSIWKAITTLRRQHATLILQADRLRKQTTLEQHARLVEKNMRRIFARQAEDAAIAQENEGGAA